MQILGAKQGNWILRHCHQLSSSKVEGSRLSIELRVSAIWCKATACGTFRSVESLWVYWNT